MLSPGSIRQSQLHGDADSQAEAGSGIWYPAARLCMAGTQHPAQHPPHSLSMDQGRYGGGESTQAAPSPSLTCHSRKMTEWVWPLMT